MMKKQIKKVAIKTVKTMSQTAVAVIGTAAVLGDVNWMYVASAAALSGIVCVLMNLSDLKVEEE